MDVDDTDEQLPREKRTIPDTTPPARLICSSSAHKKRAQAVASCGDYSQSTAWQTPPRKLTTERREERFSLGQLRAILLNQLEQLEHRLQREYHQRFLELQTQQFNHFTTMQRNECDQPTAMNYVS